MVRVFSRSPVALVQEASPVRPLVLIYNSMTVMQVMNIHHGSLNHYVSNEYSSWKFEPLYK